MSPTAAWHAGAEPDAGAGAGSAAPSSGVDAWDGRVDGRVDGAPEPAWGAGQRDFGLAFDNAPIGMSVISVDPVTTGRFLRLNKPFCRMVGHSSAALRRMSLAELTASGSAARTDPIARVTSGEVDCADGEVRLRHRDGHTVYAWLTVSMARRDDGAPDYVICHAVDVTQRRRQQEELERLALTDTLTGLANRTLLIDRLRHGLRRVGRRGGGMAVLLLDVDRFKVVNDSLGHLVGDALLVGMAARIVGVVTGGSDRHTAAGESAGTEEAVPTVARLGGDEFVVVLEGLGRDADVQPLLDRLLDELRRPYDVGPRGRALVASASIGVTTVTGGDRDPDDLLREADLALYEAKDRGRDRYALFDDRLRARAVSRLDVEHRLRTALRSGGVIVRYQPVIDLATGAVTGVEALARLADPERGELAPVTFIDVAEDTGLVVDLDVRVLEIAVEQLARWRTDPATADLRLSLNVSARSLEQSRWHTELERCLHDWNVPGEAVRVEVTEASLLGATTAVRSAIDRIASLGAVVGLDDFGTGYSALAYLQQFDLHFLKIDRSFVTGLGARGRPEALVAAIVDLAHAYDMTVVAEGVEEGPQLEALRGMRCDAAQGFLFGRPLQPVEIEMLMASRRRW